MSLLRATRRAGSIGGRLRLMATLVAVPLVVAATPAGPRAPSTMRWKINTHVFAANVALADAINDGMVTIPPFGEIPVAPAALSALREAPAAYRAGVLAPDLFPDMYVGGWFIHSDLSQTENWVADNWMRHLWTRARAWPDASERNKVMAFAYGFLTHGAGDMFAHTWVNEKAEGAWVSFTGKDRSTAFKHVVLEGYVGEHTPATDFSLDVWPRFVSNTLIKDMSARQHSKAVPHYKRWLAIYDALPPLIARAEKEMNATVGEDAPYWMKCLTNPKPCARKEQMESWRLDINRGLRALVDSSESVGERIMEGSTGDGVDALTGWAVEWLPKMHGAHALGEGTAALTEFMDWAGNLVPLDSIITHEVEQFVQEELPRVWELYQAAQKPSFWMEKPGFFPPGTKDLVNREMGVGPGDQTFDWRAFEPLYNTIVLSKLALLDGNGLNELARRAGVSAPIVPAGDQVNVMLGVFRSMTQSYQWTGELTKATTRYGICGPETGEPLPLEAVCGLGHRAVPVRGASATQVAGAGFVLWGNAEAREKIFRVVFKGFGKGPGTVDARTVANLATEMPGTREGRRVLRSAMEQVESMREIVAGMRSKIGGAAPAQLATGARQAGTQRAQAGDPAITNWGQRCCAKDIAAIRSALVALNASSARLQNPAIVARLGRKPSVTQVGARAAQANAALIAFATTRDAATATAAFANLSRHIDALAAVVAGTQ